MAEMKDETKLTLTNLEQNKTRYTYLLMQMFGWHGGLPETTEDAAWQESEEFKAQQAQVEKFLLYLRSIGFFTQPYSANYQGNYPGGLCEYVLKLYDELTILCSIYYPTKYTKQDIIRVALLRDIYRAELYETYQKNVKNETTGQWESVTAYRTKENRPFYGDIGFSSYMIAKKYFLLTDEQIEAITMSLGAPQQNIDSYNVMKAYPLVTLLKMADLAVYIGGIDPNSSGALWDFMHLAKEKAEDRKVMEETTADEIKRVDTKDSNLKDYF